MAQFTASEDALGTVPCVAVKLRYQGGNYSALFAMPSGNVSAKAGGEVKGTGRGGLLRATFFFFLGMGPLASELAI